MTIKAPTKKELQFLKLLLSGKSTKGAARDLAISTRKAYEMAEKLTYLSFIRPIPGTRSPVVYEKGDLDYSFIEGRCKRPGCRKECPLPSPRDTPRSCRRNSVEADPWDVRRGMLRTR